MIKLNENINHYQKERQILVEFQLIGLKHSKEKNYRNLQDCLECDNGKNCTGYVIEPKMNCFNCEMERVCRHD